MLQWKVHPRIQAQNGTRFPDGMLGGKYDPVFGSRTGYPFRIGLQAETAPRFDLQTGMPFPVEASSGKRIP